MGYTHYFENTKDISIEDWSKITEAAKELVELEIASGIHIVDGFGGMGTKPTINSSMICLNGEDEDSHETFLFRRTGNSDFEFCKTSNKPYDTLIVAILTIISDLEYTEFSSDGDDEDLKEGRKLGRKIFSQTQTMPAIPKIINIKKRVLFNDIDNPDSGYLIWDYGSQFLIMNSEMQVIDVFNVSEAIGDEHRAKYEAEEHFKAIRES